MKSVSLLGVYREKATGPIEAAAMPPSDVAAAPEGVTSTMVETAAATAENKSSQNKAASVHIDQEATSSLLDSLLALHESLDNSYSLLTQHSSKEEEGGDDIDVYNYDKAWTDGYI